MGDGQQESLDSILQVPKGTLPRKFRLRHLIANFQQGLGGDLEFVEQGLVPLRRYARALATFQLRLREYVRFMDVNPDHSEEYLETRRVVALLSVSGRKPDAATMTYALTYADSWEDRRFGKAPPPTIDENVA